MYLKEVLKGKTPLHTGLQNNLNFFQNQDVLKYD
jgi:hypothetical protein